MMIWKNSVITKNKIKALKPLYTNDFRALLWQGQKDLKLPLRNIVALLAWSASRCSLFLHLTAASSSAAGGGATVRPGTLRTPRFHTIQSE